VFYDYSPSNLLCCRRVGVVWSCVLWCSPWQCPTSSLRGWGIGASCCHAISTSVGIQDSGHDSWNIASCEYPFFVILSGMLASVGGLLTRRTSSFAPGGGHGCARAVRCPLPSFPPHPHWELREPFALMAVFDTKDLSYWRHVVHMMLRMYNSNWSSLLLYY